MRTMITAATVAAATALALPAPAIAQRAPAAVVIVVDSDRIYRECNACKAAQTQLQSRVTALQSRQQTLTNELRTEGQSIQAAIDALPQGTQPNAALRARAEAFQKKQNDANAELGRGQQNIQSIQANVLRQINARLNPAINQVMVAKGANIAVDVDATLAHGAGVNVTSEVLAAVNATLPSVSVTPLPQQQQQQQQQPAQPQGR